jgi:hypothetical protein
MRTGGEWSRTPQSTSTLPENKDPASKTYYAPRVIHGTVICMFMPDHIRNLDEWLIWLLAEEFHQSATIDLIVQRTGYRREDVISSVAALERAKAIAVYRDARQAMNIDHIRLVPGGMRSYEELKKRVGTG